MKTAWSELELTGLLTRPWKRRWSCACLWRSTWKRIGTFQPTQELLTWVRLAQHRFEPPTGAKPKWARRGLSLPRIPESLRRISGIDAQPGKLADDRCAFGAPSQTYPGQHLPKIGLPPGKSTPSRFNFGLPTLDRQSPFFVGKQAGFDQFGGGHLLPRGSVDGHGGTPPAGRRGNEGWTAVR